MFSRKRYLSFSKCPEQKHPTPLGIFRNGIFPGDVICLRYLLTDEYTEDGLLYLFYVLVLGFTCLKNSTVVVIIKCDCHKLYDGKYCLGNRICDLRFADEPLEPLNCMNSYGIDKLS